jgi:hypothetical protein
LFEAGGNNIKWYTGTGYTNLTGTPADWIADSWRLVEIGIRCVRGGIAGGGADFRFSYDKGDQLGWTAMRTDTVGSSAYFIPTHLYMAQTAFSGTRTVYIDKIEVKNLDPKATGLHNI